MIEPHAEGWLLSVRAVPGARRNEIRGEQDGALKVCVTQIAEKGKANSALRDLLATTLGVKKSQVELYSGQTSNRKKFLVCDVSRAELQARLQRLRQ